MSATVRRFEIPDETRTFEKGRFDLIRIASVVVGRAEYEAGWKWSEHVGPQVGADTCDVEHVVLVVSGRCAIAMNDGTHFELGPGDFCHVPAGHDSWVVGDESYVSLHFMGSETYADSP
jgi:quercetin dioxygenase-like cupin family protein